jgi:hypothetical protein
MPLQRFKDSWICRCWTSIFQVCLIYLDDIIVFSKDITSHLQRLELLFIRLRQANLKLKPSKCHLLQKEVSFLGFTVSSRGVGTDASKISSIVDWPRPKNLRESHAFVGLCQYYRRFVPNFSTAAAPLHPRRVPYLNGMLHARTLSVN